MDTTSDMEWSGVFLEHDAERLRTDFSDYRHGSRFVFLWPGHISGRPYQCHSDSEAHMPNRCRSIDTIHRVLALGCGFVTELGADWSCESSDHDSPIFGRWAARTAAREEGIALLPPARRCCNSLNFSF